MASSDSEVPEQVAAFFERFLRQRNLSLFLPFFLGLADPPPSDTNPSQDTSAEESSTTTETTDVPSIRTRDRIILINPFTQGMVVIEGGSAASLENILRDLGNKSGQPPASKASIEALTGTFIEGGEDEEGECVICLENWEVGAEVKAMPCSHKFHPGCIEKWMGMHGSCPVCRYTMPVDEEDGNKNREGIERMRRMEREIWVSFSFSGGRSSDEVEGGGTWASANESD